MNSMILSSITKSSLFGYTVEMQNKRVNNQSTSLECNNELGLEAATGVPPK